MIIITKHKEFRDMEISYLKKMGARIERLSLCIKCLREKSSMKKIEDDLAPEQKDAAKKILKGLF